MARLIVISGLPGVGKSAVAERVAAALGAVHLSVDPVEDALLGAGLQPGWTTGVAAYEAVRAAAETNLALGTCVVVDAVNDSEPARETWTRAAGDAEVTWVVLTCSDAVEHRRRLEARRRPFAHVPEPGWEAVRARAAAYESWGVDHLLVDTVGRSIEAVSAEVTLGLGASRRATP